MRGCTPVIVTLRRQSQEDGKFKDSLGHVARPCPEPGDTSLPPYQGGWKPAWTVLGTEGGRGKRQITPGLCSSNDAEARR